MQPVAAYSAGVIGELQRIADRLAAQLGLGVAIDDPRIRQYVYTYSRGMDDARRDAVLQRQGSPEVVRWVQRNRIADRIGAFVLPPNAEIGMTSARWGAVARVEGRAVAYLWAQTDATEIDAASARLLVDAAENVAEVIARQQRSDALHSLAERETVSDLVSDDPAQRRRAVERISDAEAFRLDRSVAAFVVRPVPLGQSELGETERMTTAGALDDLRLQLPTREAMALVRSDHALVVVSVPDDSTPAWLAGLAEAARAKVQKALGDKGFSTWAGIGRSTLDLRDTHRSYREALTAAQVAAAMGTLGATVAHSNLGVLSRVAEVVGVGSGHAREVEFQPGIETLLRREEQGDPLAHTLEVFLDHAGDATGSAEVLHLHRASLYTRLKRIEELTGLDMASGHDRFLAHFELKIARLTGRRPAVSHVDQQVTTSRRLRAAHEI